MYEVAGSEVVANDLAKVRVAGSNPVVRSYPPIDLPGLSLNVGDWDQLEHHLKKVLLYYPWKTLVILR